MSKCIKCNHETKVIINSDYDVPYTAGYSKDGSTIYIDRKIPKTYVDSQGKTVNVYRYLIIHEVTEKSLKDELLFKYNEAHSIAMGAEMHACTMDGVNYDEYYGFLGKYVKQDIKPEDFSTVPPDLDIQPYVEDGLTDVVKKIKELQKSVDKKPKQ